MGKRIVTGDSPECPASHGFGKNSMRWYVQANVEVFGVVASVMTWQEHPDNGFGQEPAWLWWSDGISDWCEEFPNVSSAFGRLALLVSLGEDGWLGFFDRGTTDFALAWKAWSCQMQS